VVPINFLPYQAALAVKEGLAWPTAVRALTIHPAQIAGIDDRLGSLEPGKDADLVIWSGDPLDVLSRVERAFIGGAEIYTAGAARNGRSRADSGRHPASRSSTHPASGEGPAGSPR
jgi:imidazolonepropionase-like amidohydrolase